MPQRRSRGALEAAVLEMLWAAGRPLSARELRERFAEGLGGDPAVDGETPALTTVLTVLERLQGKGLVLRTRSEDGRAMFSAARSQSGLAADAMVAALKAATDRDTVLLRFARRLDEHELDLLRKALGGGGGKSDDDPPAGR